MQGKCLLYNLKMVHALWLAMVDTSYAEWQDARIQDDKRHLVARRVHWCNVSILGTHLRHTKVIKHCSMTFTTVISLLDTGFVIPPCQPQNRANDMTSQNILYLMNHWLDWCQYRLKLKPTYYSIIHEFLLIFQLYLTALLINLFSIAKHWHGFEGYCNSISQ